MVGKRDGAFGMSTFSRIYSFLVFNFLTYLVIGALTPAPLIKGDGIPKFKDSAGALERSRQIPPKSLVMTQNVRVANLYRLLYGFSASSVLF